MGTCQVFIDYSDGLGAIHFMEYWNGGKMPAHPLCVVAQPWAGRHRSSIP